MSAIEAKVRGIASSASATLAFFWLFPFFSVVRLFSSLA
jgi:hypothetical protein